MLLVDADGPEPVRSGARELALFLTPEPGAEVGDGGWRWGTQVRGWGAGTRAPWGRSGGRGPPALWAPDPNPRPPRSILSHRRSGPGPEFPSFAER